MLEIIDKKVKVGQIKGKHMNKPIPISECGDNPEIQEILRKLETGEIHLNTGKEDIPEWTPEEIARLDSVLAKVYGWEQK